MFRKIFRFLFENKTAPQMVAKNTFWLAFGDIVSRSIRAILIIYAGRILGTSGYGVFSYALSLAAFFTVFSDLGISGVLTRELVQKIGYKKYEYFWTASILKLLAIVLFIFVTILVAPHITKIEEAKPLIPIVAILLAFDSLKMIGFSVTRSNNRMEMESFFSILTNFLITVLGLFVLVMSPSPMSLSIAYTLGSALGAIFLFTFIRRFLKEIKFRFSPGLAKHILQAAAPFALSGLLGAFMINIDMIIIGMFRTAEELGLYGAAQRIVQFVYMIPGFLAISMFPIISKYIKTGDRKKVSVLFLTLARTSLTFAIPVALGGIILSKEIIVFLFGKEYIQASTAFAMLSLTISIMGISALISNSLFALNKQKVFVKSSFIGSLINVVLDMLLIPKYGIAGSALVTIIALSAVVFYNWIKLKEDVKIYPGYNLFNPLLATIVLSLLLLIAKHYVENVILLIVGGGMIYLILLFIFRDRFFEDIKLVFKK